MITMRAGHLPPPAGSLTIRSRCPSARFPAVAWGQVASPCEHWDNRCGEPAKPRTTVQRLAGRGYDWHNVMHMIAAVINDDLHQILTEQRPFDPDGYAGRLRLLPGDWPPPEELGLR